MAGLSDMEELIATVPEKDTADYLREAFICYGAGAYRGCIVLTHTALFEGLRAKLHSVAPVNKKAKAVLNQIEPLAAAQKVFESKLVDQMKEGGIITQLEAQILSQLNSQRNKAAHPSGHAVTAEEARYVFSEAIQKFLSLPIRQTSVLVDSIIARLSEHNFFPGSTTDDMQLVVDEETASLDALGYPPLIAKLAENMDSADNVTARNAKRFVLALARRQEPQLRAAIIKSVISAKASDVLHTIAITQLIAVDPHFLDEAPAATKVRVAALLLRGGKDVGVEGPFAELRSPARILGVAVAALGEAFMVSTYNAFTDWVIDQAPTAPEFIEMMVKAPTLFGSLYARYLAQASSSQFATSNAFATKLPGMDEALAEAVSGEDAFRLLLAIAKGAEFGAYDPIALRDARFESLPNLKAEAVAFISSQATKAKKILSDESFPEPLLQFKSKYVDPVAPA